MLGCRRRLMARHSSFNSLFFIVKLLIIFQCGHSFVLVKAPTRLGQLEIWMGSRNALRQQLVFFSKNHSICVQKLGYGEEGKKPHKVGRNTICAE